MLGPSPVSGDTSDPPVPASMVDSGPGPPELGIGRDCRTLNPGNSSSGFHLRPL